MICGLYKQSCDAAPTDWHVKEQENILDPHYRLLSYVGKRLLNGVVSPLEAHDIIRHSIPDEWIVPSTTLEGSGDGSELRAKDVFQLILDILGRFMQVDKKKWQHKFLWKVFSDFILNYSQVFLDSISCF